MDTTNSLSDVAILEKKRKAFESRIANVNNQTKNLYSDKHDTPFIVFIERVDFQQEYDLKFFSDFSFGKKLSNIVPDHMKNSFNLKKSGIYRFSINFKSYVTANDFIGTFNRLDEFMKNQSWKAHIPFFKFNYTAILGNIDSNEITCNDILENLLPFNHADKWVTPTHVEHMYRFKKNIDESV